MCDQQSETFLTMIPKESGAIEGMETGHGELRGVPNIVKVRRGHQNFGVFAKGVGDPLGDSAHCLHMGPTPT